MSKQDPFTPPAAEYKESRFMYGSILHDTFAALVLLQLIISLRHGWAFFEFVSIGSVSPLALLLTLAGSTCLYLGTVLLRFKASSKQTLFLLAGVAFALAIPLWRNVMIAVLVSLFGAVLGAAGWWLARRRTRGLDMVAPETGMLRSNQSVVRPISVYLIFLLSFSPVVFILLFLSDNWVGLESELTSRALATRTDFPLMIATMFFPPLLFMSGGFLLLFLRKQAIILFAMYLVLKFGKVLSSGGAPLTWLDLLLVLGVTAYSIRLLQQRVLH